MDLKIVSNISDIIDLLLNGEVAHPRFAFVMIVCEARDNKIGGETRLLTNIDDLAANTLLNIAVKELNSKMGNA